MGALVLLCLCLQQVLLLLLLVMLVLLLVKVAIHEHAELLQLLGLLRLAHQAILVGFCVVAEGDVGVSGRLVGR